MHFSLPFPGIGKALYRIPAGMLLSDIFHDEKGFFPPVKKVAYPDISEEVSL